MILALTLLFWSLESYFSYKVTGKQTEDYEKSVQNIYFLIMLISILIGFILDIKIILAL